jgi:hypothetical protein
VHVPRRIRLNRLVVEPRAVAVLPLRSAYHTKLGAASARHVVAAFFELHNGLASKAPLPTLFLGLQKNLICLVVFGTLRG